MPFMRIMTDIKEEENHNGIRNATSAIEELITLRGRGGEGRYVDNRKLRNINLPRKNIRTHITNNRDIWIHTLQSPRKLNSIHRLIITIIHKSSLLRITPLPLHLRRNPSKLPIPHLTIRHDIHGPHPKTFRLLTSFLTPTPCHKVVQVHFLGIAAFVHEVGDEVVDDHAELGGTASLLPEDFVGVWDGEQGS